MRGFFEDIGYPIKGPTKVYCDNRSLVTLSGLESIIGRSRYMANQVNFIREHIQDGIISVVFCPTSLMVADIFTKLLARSPFEYCARILMEGHSGLLPEDRVEMRPQ